MRLSPAGEAGSSAEALYRLTLHHLATVEGRVRDGVGEGVSVGVGDECPPIRMMKLRCENEKF